jgi:hypothetical protein
LGAPSQDCLRLAGIAAGVDTALNVYTQVLDGSARAAADRVGSELFTIVHTPESVERVDG